MGAVVQPTADFRAVDLTKSGGAQGLRDIDSAASSVPASRVTSAAASPARAGTAAPVYVARGA